MIMYRTGGTKLIEAVEVVKETSFFVTLADGKRAGKRGDLINHFNTWEEAKAHLFQTAERRLKIARRNLQLANSYIGNVKGLKKETK